MHVQTKIRKNLLDVYGAATHTDIRGGLDWYAEANQDCERVALQYGVTLEVVVGVVAAISPGLSWELNIKQAEQLVTAYVNQDELPMVGVYGKMNRDKAVRILGGTNPLEVLPKTAPKTRSFYQNILEPHAENTVTVDRHAKCAAYGAANSKNSIVRTYEYEFLSEQYKRVARELGMLPHQFQAIVWVTWRKLKAS